MSRVKIPDFYILNENGQKLILPVSITNDTTTIDDEIPPDTLQYLYTKESNDINVFAGHGDFPTLMFAPSSCDELCDQKIQQLIADFTTDVIICQHPDGPLSRPKAIKLSRDEKNNIISMLIQPLMAIWSMLKETTHSGASLTYERPLQQLFKQLNEAGADFREFLFDFTEKLLYTDSVGHDFLLQIFKNALEAVKPNISDTKLFNAPTIFTILMQYSKSGSEEQMKVIKKCLAIISQSGIDIWQKHEIFGSFLHYSIANENHYVVNLLEMMIELKTPMALNCQDAQGRTALMCAILTRQTDVAEKLIAITHDIKDPTERRKLLDIKDTQGCTALMLATGLGMEQIVSMLIKSGANPNLKDNKKCDWEYYTKLPKEDVETLFHSIAMHPDRSIIASSNYFRGASKPGAPLMLVSGTTETRLVKSSSSENMKLINDVVVPQLKKMKRSAPDKLQKQVIDHYLDEINQFLLSTPHPDHATSAAPAAAELTTCSISEQAIKDQTSIRVFIKNYQEQQSIRAACARGDLDLIKSLLPLILATKQPHSDHLGRTLFFYLTMREAVSKPYLQDSSSFEEALPERKKIAELLIKNGITPSTKQRHIGGKTTFDVLNKNVGKELPPTAEGYLQGLEMMSKR